MIYVTGAGTGYLGNRVLTLLRGEGRWLPRDRYHEAAGQTVIHCADVVPKTMGEAETMDLTASVCILRRLLEHKPAFVVFPSTLTGTGNYLLGKRVSERHLELGGVPYHVLRFPGLWGPPKARGVMFDLFKDGTLPPDGWTGMHVDDAAQRCITVALYGTQGVTDCHDARLDAWLDFVRHA